MKKIGRFGRITAMLILTILFSACSNQNPVLPTVAQLPTSTPEIATAEAVSSRPTLPPEWTATPTPTLTVTPVFTETPSVTPSATITDTPSPTATDLPTIPPEERARTSLLQDLILDMTRLPPGPFIATLAPTPLPATMTPPPGILVVPSTPGPGSIVIPTIPPVNTGNGGVVCPFFPAGGFGAVFANNPDVAAALGCPEGSPPDVLSMPGAWQPFQNGTMLWLNGEIFVLKTADNTFQRFPDNYVAGTDPETTSEVPPSGMVAPVRGFLKVWTTYSDVRPALGWGIAAESGAQATIQRFSRGRMVWLPGRSDILVLLSTDANVNSGTWRSFSGQF